MDALDDLGDLGALLVGVENLASLVSQPEPFETTLQRIAEFSASAVTGSEHVAISMVINGRPAALAASDDAVLEAEALQFELGEGPTVTAISEGAVATSGSLGGEPAWPRFGSTVARRGLHSVLVVPMAVPDSIIGALSVYASGKDAFDDDSVRRAQRYAVSAAAVVHNLHVLHQSRLQIQRLSDALTTRSVIDQAIGILRSRNGCSADEAFQRLRRISNTDRVKLVDVANQVVERSVRRVRARRPAAD